MASPEEILSKLVKGMAAGNRQSLNQLYKLEADRIFAVLMRIVRDREVAADLLHDVFVKLWTGAPQFQPDRAPARVWMVGIARNAAIDHLRRHENARRADLGDSALAESAKGAVDAYIRDQNADRLRSCLEDLRPDWQHMVAKAYVEGHSYPELSRDTGVPVNTIKSWMHRALAQLRACITARDE